MTQIMKAEPFKPELRLMIQAFVPVDDVPEGEALYDELRIFLQAYNPDVKINASIIKTLEPCCPEKKDSEQNEKTTNGSK